MSEFKSWSGKKIDFKAWWNAKKGSKIQGVVVQRNRASGGTVRTPYYVLQLTNAKGAEGKMRDKSIELAKGDYVAVAENNQLIGLDELLGYEVIIQLVDETEFTTEDGEVRSLKQFDVKHSEEVVNQEAAKRRPQPSAR